MVRVSSGLPAAGIFLGPACNPAFPLEPDLILHSGQVLTVDPAFSTGPAMAIRGDHIELTLVGGWVVFVSPTSTLQLPSSLR